MPGKKCAVVNVIDHTSVLIDGNVRRRRCNVRHLEPLSDVIDIKKDASHEEVESAFKKLKNTLLCSPGCAQEKIFCRFKGK